MTAADGQDRCVDAALAAQLEQLLVLAGPANVPSGVLVWFGKTDFPAGNDPEPRAIGPSEWSSVYSRLQHGDLTGTLPSPAAIAARAAQPGQVVPIAIASIGYERPTTRTVESVREAARAGTVAVLPEDPLLETAETTIATPLLAGQWHRAVPVHRGRSIRLVLDEHLLIANGGSTIHEVAITFAGESHALTPDPVTIEAPPDVSTIELLITCQTSRGERSAACTLAVSDEPVPPAPDEIWQLTPDGANTGHAYVWRAGSGERLTRPVLIAEGWPGGATPLYLAEALGQHDMLDRLRLAGHDVIAVGFDKGIDSIQSNAPVVSAAIARALARTSDKLVVGGMSMGGLVSRYALLEMEHRGEDHGAAIYLSIDTPHGRGAYTTVCGQWFVNHFKQVAGEYDQLSAAIQSPSNRQFVALIERDGTVGPDPLRTTLLTELEAMGKYPNRPVKLAIACGTGAGNLDTPPSSPVMRWESAGIADVVLSPMPSGGTAVVGSGTTLAAPSCRPAPLVVSSQYCWESLPGALNVLNAEVTGPVAALGADIVTTLGTSSSVPTVSALDIDGDPNQPIPPPNRRLSPFDDYLCANSNRRHLDLSAEHVDWIVDRIELHQPPSSQPRRRAMPTQGTTINPATFDPNDHDYLADPYPTYAWFREHLPVAELNLIPGHTPPSYWVFCDKDVRAVLETTDVFLKHASGPGSPPAPPAPPVFGSFSTLPPGLLSSDPPRHTAMRNVVSPIFDAVLADAPAYAEHAVSAALARLSSTRRLELVQDFALPVPSTVLAQVLGLPVADLKVLDGWVQAIVTAHNVALGPKTAALGGTCAMAMRTYFDALIHENPLAWSKGLLAGMCEHVDMGLDRRNVQVIMSDMLVAGFLTTTFLICTGMKTLLQSPAQLASLRADESLVDRAVEEMLRFDAPAQLLDRQVGSPVTLGGVALQPGARVVAVVGSANRDAVRYEDPDTFDIDRTETTHLGFGDGIHHCIGAPLARIVVPAAIRGLLQLDGLRLDGQPQWQADPYLRGLTSLPVRYGG